MFYMNNEDTITSSKRCFKLVALKQSCDTRFNSRDVCGNNLFFDSATLQQSLAASFYLSCVLQNITEWKQSPVSQMLDLACRTYRYCKKQICCSTSKFVMYIIFFFLFHILSFVGVFVQGVPMTMLFVSWNHTPFSFVPIFCTT